LEESYAASGPWQSQCSESYMFLAIAVFQV